jgi:hypothetical protein
MYIPATGLMPSMPSIHLPPEPEPVEAPARTPPTTPAPSRKAEPARKPAFAEPAGLEPIELPEERTLLPQEPAPKKRVSAPDESDEPAVAEAVADEEAKAKPKKHFSLIAVLLLVLANLGLAAFAVSPFLPGPTLESTGDFATLPRPQGISSEQTPLVIGAPAVVALFGLMTLLGMLLTRRIGFANLFLLYVATIGSAILLLLSLEFMQKEMGPDGNLAKLQRSIEDRRAKGQDGEATPAPGVQYYSMAGGAAAASLFFILAGVFMHRRLPSKLLGFLALAFLPALAVAWVFRKLLGIDAEFMPFDLPGL